MKKLLYITANPKPESLSASKTVGRQLVNRIIQKTADYHLEEVDLYADHIPQLKHIYYESRSTLISEDKIKFLGISRFEELLVDGTGIYDYNQNRSVLTNIAEWLEGGDYFNFIRKVRQELKENFLEVKIIAAGDKAVFYVCKPHPVKI